MATDLNRWNTNKTLLSALESSSRIIQRVMANNFILLERAGISVNEQIRQIEKRTDGFRLSKSRMSHLKAGREKKIDITILSVLADYHNLPLEELITSEMWLE